MGRVSSDQTDAFEIGIYIPSILETHRKHPWRKATPRDCEIYLKRRDTDLTLKSIGAEYSISAERVRQICARIHRMENYRHNHREENNGEQTYGSGSSSGEHDRRRDTELRS